MRRALVVWTLLILCWHGQAEQHQGENQVFELGSEEQSQDPIVVPDAEAGAYTKAEMKQASDGEQERTAATTAEMAQAQQTRAEWLQKLKFAQSAITAAAKPLAPATGVTSHSGIPVSKEESDPVLLAQSAAEEAAKHAQATENEYEQTSTHLLEKESKSQSLAREVASAKRSDGTAEMQLSALTEELVDDDEALTAKKTNLARVTTRIDVEKEKAAVEMQNIEKQASQAKDAASSGAEHLITQKAKATKLREKARSELRKAQVKLTSEEQTVHAKSVESEHLEAIMRKAERKYSTIEDRREDELVHMRNSKMDKLEDAHRLAHRESLKARHKEEDARMLAVKVEQHKVILSREKAYAEEVQQRGNETIQAAENKLEEAKAASSKVEAQASSASQQLEGLIAEKATEDEQNVESNQKVDEAKQADKAATKALADAEIIADKELAQKQKVAFLTEQERAALETVAGAQETVPNSTAMVSNAEDEKEGAKLALKAAETGVQAAGEANLEGRKKAKLAAVAARAASAAATAHFKAAQDTAATKAKAVMANATATRKSVQKAVDDAADELDRLKGKAELLQQKVDQTNEASSSAEQKLEIGLSDNEIKAKAIQRSAAEQTARLNLHLDEKKKKLASATEAALRIARKENQAVTRALTTAEHSEVTVKKRVQKQVQRSQKAGKAELALASLHNQEQIQTAQSNEQQVEDAAKEKAQFVFRKAKSLSGSASPEDAARQHVYASKLEEVAKQGQQDIKAAQENTARVQTQVEEEKIQLEARIAAEEQQISDTGAEEIQSAQKDVELANTTSLKAAEDMQAAEGQEDAARAQEKAALDDEAHEEAKTIADKAAEKIGELNQTSAEQKLLVDKKKAEAFEAGSELQELQQVLDAKQADVTLGLQTLGAQLQAIDDATTAKVSALKAQDLNGEPGYNELTAVADEASKTAANDQKELPQLASELQAAKHARDAAVAEVIDAGNAVAAQKESVQLNEGMVSKAQLHADNLKSDLTVAEGKLKALTEQKASALPMARAVSAAKTTALQKTLQEHSEALNISNTLGAKIEVVKTTEARLRADSVAKALEVQNRESYLSRYQTAAKVADTEAKAQILHGTQELQLANKSYLQAQVVASAARAAAAKAMLEVEAKTEGDAEAGLILADMAKKELARAVASNASSAEIATLEGEVARANTTVEGITTDSGDVAAAMAVVKSAQSEVSTAIAANAPSDTIAELSEEVSKATRILETIQLQQAAGDSTGIPNADEDPVEKEFSLAKLRVHNAKALYLSANEEQKQAELAVQFTQHNITNLENRIRTVKEETSTISVTAVERDAALRTVADLAEQELRHESERNRTLTSRADKLVREAQVEVDRAEEAIVRLKRKVPVAEERVNTTKQHLQNATVHYQDTLEETTKAESQVEHMADERNAARVAAAHAADQLLATEQAFQMRNAQKLKEDLAVSKTIAANAAEAVKVAKDKQIEAAVESQAKIAEEKQKTEVEKEVLAEKVKHQLAALADATEQQTKQYEEQVAEHQQKMEAVQDAARDQESGAAQVVDKVNKFFEASQDEAKAHLAKILEETQEAEAKTREEERQATAEATTASQIEKSAAAAEKKQKDAEDAQAQAEADLQAAKLKAIGDDAEMHKQLEEAEAKLKEEEAKTNEAEDDVKQERAATAKAEDKLFTIEQNRTQTEGALAIVKLKEDAEVSMAEAAVAAASNKANAQIQSQNASAIQEQATAEQEARVNLRLAKLQEEATVDNAQHQADMNISNVEYSAQQAIQEAHAEASQADTRARVAENAIKAANEQEELALNRTRYAEEELTALTSQALPSMEELDEKTQTPAR